MRRVLILIVTGALTMGSAGSWAGSYDYDRQEKQLKQIQRQFDDQKRMQEEQDVYRRLEDSRARQRQEDNDRDARRRDSDRRMRYESDESLRHGLEILRERRGY